MNWLNRWELYAFGSAFFAGLTAILGKLGVAAVNSNLATFIRTLVIIAVTAVILFIRDEWRKPESIPANTWLFLTLSGIATGLSWLCYYRALQLGPVTKVATIDKLSVVFAILLGVLFLGEHLTWQLAVGGSLIVLGSLVMVLF
jgi:bacterial/archaeal transporter family protein